MASTGGRARPTGKVDAKVIKGGEGEIEPQGQPAATWLTARYQDGDLRVSVVSSAAYGANKRTATASYDVPEDDESLGALRDALDDLLEAHGEAAQTKAQIAAARSLTYAADHGEE